MKKYHQERPSCPCKQLPMCLSSFTAAQYGDLHSLSKLGRSVIDRHDVGGYTPLHLAAQNGHTAATALLLHWGAPVDDSSQCGATPLHRASFSGAITTSKLLLDAKASLTVRDSSFGDKRTPLHKAAAGGRHLVVQLLLDAWKREDDINVGLELLDANGSTPLDVAKEMQRTKDHDSVKRWDVVAGGPPDWDACVDLLQQAQNGTDDMNGYNYNNGPTTAVPPAHLSSAASCLDCDDGTNSGRCLTMSWEAAFRSVLISSVDQSTRRISGGTPQTRSVVAPRNATAIMPSLNSSLENQDDHQTWVATCADAKSPVGRNCATCGALVVAFFRVNNNLVCKSCFIATRRRRFLDINR